MSRDALSVQEASVRHFNPTTGVATVVIPGSYGMEPFDAQPFRQGSINPSSIKPLAVGDRVLVTQSENQPPEWMMAYVTSDPLAAWPVGSIFITVVATNPAVQLGGGTWAAFAVGRMLVGLNPADADFDTSQETGGAKAISAAMLPAHSHTMDHNHVAATTGAASTTNTSAADVSHTHTFSDTTTGADVSHTHTFSDTSSTTSLNGAHAHTVTVRENPISGSAGEIGLSNAGGVLVTKPTDTEAAHSHSVSVSGTTAGHSVNHTHVASGTTGGHSVNHTHPHAHTHTVDFAATTGLVTGNGPGTAATSLPPYIVTYMWRRTA